LFNHHLRPCASDDRFDRLRIEYIRDRKLDALFRQSPGFFRRTCQDDESVSSGKQFRDQWATYRSRSTRNKNLHL